jgi:hypothetical protein
MIASTAVDAAFKAFMTGELERVSPWSPVIWPYYTGLAVGLCGLILQTLAEMVRHAMKIIAPAADVGRPAPVEMPALQAKLI